MTNLEKLYKMNIALDKQIDRIKESQNELEKEVIEKKKVAWENMYDKLVELSKYSVYLDTGYCRCKDTIGFEVRDNFIIIISWKHYDCDGRKLAEPRTDTYACSIERDKPFYTSGHFSYWMEHLVEIMDDWDYHVEQMEKNLEARMIREMQKKIANTEKRQVELENELNRY